MIHVMLCEGFCHGSWWFMSWFVVICSDLWFVVIHVMLNLWWFIVICDDSCHHLWWSMSWFVVVCGSSVKNSLRYWPKHAFFSQNMGCYPLFQSSRKGNPTSWRFCANLSRIHWDIDWNVQFSVKTWGCYPSFRSSRKVNPTSWRFHANPSRIHWDIDHKHVMF